MSPLWLLLSGNKAKLDWLCGLKLPVILHRDLWGKNISRSVSCDLDTSDLCCRSYHRVFACLHGVTLQDSHNNHLHDEEGVAHSNAVPRAESKWHEGVWVHLIHVVLTEPAPKISRFRVTARAVGGLLMLTPYISPTLNVIFLFILHLVFTKPHLSGLNSSGELQ